jgi:hypothetical protein
MNPRHPPVPRCLAITLLEVTLLMAGLAVLAALLLPGLLRPRVHVCRINCVNNLKQVGLGYRLWAMDHQDRFPMALTSSNGGTRDHPLRAEAWVHLEPLAHELNTPKVLVCPEDTQRRAATTFEAGFRNPNLSYFVGLEADETRPGVILSGDRNLTSNGIPISPGLFRPNGQDHLGWTKALHRGCGNIALSDGSVMQCSPRVLQQHRVSHLQTNQLAIP